MSQSMVPHFDQVERAAAEAAEQKTDSAVHREQQQEMQQVRPPHIDTCFDFDDAAPAMANGEATERAGPTGGGGGQLHSGNGHGQQDQVG